MADDSDLDMDDLRISDEEEHAGAPPPGRTFTSRGQQQQQRAPPDQDSRDAVLRAELAGVRQINKVIEGVIGSLDKAKANMETVASTVNNADKLLNLWIRILSQTEHTQRLILNGHWEGASKDITDLEAEAIARANDAARRREDERERELARERERAAAAAAREAAENRPSAGTGKGGSSGYGRVKKTVGGAAGTDRGTGTGGGSSSAAAETTRGRGAPRGLRRGTGRVGTAGRGVGRGVK
ncbi:DASH complex subunit Duo1 [Peziza echinospora]|nr:DASH complex subunit Duo1 [Peziza echinospora]